MSIPDFQTLMKPVLTTVADGADHNTRALINRMSDEFNLTEEERASRLPSNRQTVMANRVHWAITYLFQCGLIARPARATYRITDRGRDVLKEIPPRIDLGYLDQFPELAEFRGRATAGIETPPESVQAMTEAARATPDERIELAYKEIEASLKEALIARVFSGTPAFFERLVIQLLLKMGYGEPQAGLHLGGPRDGGVDGVIKLDKLGIDKVYIQAKRYAPENTISRDAIQAFSGALDPLGTTRGVFVTTSSFSRDAIDYSTNLTQKQIVLVDGDQLASLLIDHDVGVRQDRVLTIKRLDEDFFEE